MLARERFNRKWQLDPETNCWVWTAAKYRNGYGAFNWNGRKTTAHRASYELHVGDASPDMEIDHLCRNRGCVNPSHLEMVTPQINTLRGEGLAAQNARATHCPHGHEYSVKNTIHRKDGKRMCKECVRIRRNSPENRAYMATWRENNRDKCELYQLRHMEKLHGF